MRRVAFLFGLTAAVTVLPGCLVISETRRDQDKIRTTLNTLYEDQIIDNLIRAANGLPFVQIDYTNATTTITVTESGNVGGTQTTGPNSTNIVGSALRFAHQFTNIWTYGLSGQNSNQIALTANPVITSNEVYDAYLQFLADPGSLIVSCDPPPEGNAHICRKWQGKYYWVPIEYRFLFLKLALVTTSQRGKRLQPVDDFFPVQVKNVLFEEKGDRNVTFLTVKLDGPIPSDNGRIEFTIDSKRVQFGVDQPPAPLGSPPRKPATSSASSSTRKRAPGQSRAWRTSRRGSRFRASVPQELASPAALHLKPAGFRPVPARTDPAEPGSLAMTRC